MKQSKILSEGEGDAWLARNIEQLRARTPGSGRTWRHVAPPDIVCDVIAAMNLKPKRVMEIGSANGWRLDRLRDKYDCQVFGCEPSRKACTSARARKVNTHRVTAEALPNTRTQWADLLIYGFCLYLADPEDWQKIAAEGDRVLQTGGHLMVYDFDATGTPHKVPYRHREGMFSYHYDFAQLWLGNPLYTMVTRVIQEDVAVTVLKKLPAANIKALHEDRGYRHGLDREPAPQEPDRVGA